MKYNSIGITHATDAWREEEVRIQFGTMPLLLALYFLNIKIRAKSTPAGDGQDIYELPNTILAVPSQRLITNFHHLRQHEYWPKYMTAA